MGFLQSCVVKVVDKLVITQSSKPTSKQSEKSKGLNSINKNVFMTNRKPFKQNSWLFAPFHLKERAKNVEQLQFLNGSEMATVSLPIHLMENQFV